MSAFFFLLREGPIYYFMWMYWKAVFGPNSEANYDTKEGTRLIRVRRFAIAMD